MRSRSSKIFKKPCSFDAYVFFGMLGFKCFSKMGWRVGSYFLYFFLVSLVIPLITNNVRILTGAL